MKYIVTFFVIFSITILLIHFFIHFKTFIEHKAIEVYINGMLIIFVLVFIFNNTSFEEIAKDIRTEIRREIKLIVKEFKIAIHEITHVEGDDITLGDIFVMRAIRFIRDKLDRKFLIKDLEVREKSITFVMS